MAYVIAAPEMMTAAAADLAAIGSNVSAAHLVAAAPTVAVVPAAADEVSAGIAHLFSQHAQGYQALAGQAAAFQEQFVQHLNGAGAAYAAAEAANAAVSQPLTASAASIGSAIGALPGQLLNLSNAVGGQLLHDFVAFLGSHPMWQGLVAVLAFILFAVIVISFGLLVGLVNAPYLLLTLLTGQFV
jgi:hypothetical protein